LETQVATIPFHLTQRVKFTSSGEVCVAANFIKSEADSRFFLFEVTDTGPGIDELDQVELFKDFK